jgi:hypothetical protein
MHSEAGFFKKLLEETPGVTSLIIKEPPARRPGLGVSLAAWKAIS